MANTFRQVFLATLTGPTQVINTCPSETVGSFKRRVQEMVGIPVTQQRLVFAGRELAGDNLNLSKFLVSSEPTVHLLLGLRGGLKSLKILVQRPGRDTFIALRNRGPDDPDDPEWDAVLSGLYRKIEEKLGSGHVFSFTDANNHTIEIEDSDTFVSAVDPTIKNLTLRYVPTESASQAAAAIAG